MSHLQSLARNQNQLSEQLQLLELLRKRRANRSLEPAGDWSLGRLAELGSRRGRLAIQDNETLMLQLVALSLVGQTRGDTFAVALDKRDASNFTFVLATNRRQTPADEDRARRFFDVAASADSVRALLLCAVGSSSRKVNARLAKLRRTIVQCLPAVRRLVQRYRWPRNELRRRAQELLPVMRAKFGDIPLPALYVKILQTLARAVSQNHPFHDSLSGDDYDHLVDIMNMTTFILSTRFVSWMAKSDRHSDRPMAVLERRLYRVAQYMMGATSLLEMRRTLPRNGEALPYVWAVVGGEPRMVEDIFLLRTPLEVARELDARWTESALRTKVSNMDHWVPFASPRIHAELRLIASCNRAFLDPSFDTYDPRKPAAVRIASSHDVCALCALWVTVYNRHFGTRFKVFPMGGSGKMDRNWAFVLSPRERPDQDVSELVYDLLEDELERLQDASRASWGVILRSLTLWRCLLKPNERTTMIPRREPNRDSAQTYVASSHHASDPKVATKPPSPVVTPLVDTDSDAPAVQKGRAVIASAKYAAMRHPTTADGAAVNTDIEAYPTAGALPSQSTESCEVGVLRAGSELYHG